MLQNGQNETQNQHKVHPNDPSDYTSSTYVHVCRGSVPVRLPLDSHDSLLPLDSNVHRVHEGVT